jgi:hypothetical protein
MHALRPTRFVEAIAAAHAGPRATFPPTLATLAPRGVPAGVALVVALLATLLLTVGLATVAARLSPAATMVPAGALA